MCPVHRVDKELPVPEGKRVAIKPSFEDVIRHLIDHAAMLNRPSVRKMFQMGLCRRAN